MTCNESHINTTPIIWQEHKGITHDQINQMTTLEAEEEYERQVEEWKKSNREAIKRINEHRGTPAYRDRLRVALFDDGDQMQFICLRFSKESDGFVTYKEPKTAHEIPKEVQVDYFSIPHARYAPENDMFTRWICSQSDLRREDIFLDMIDTKTTYGIEQLGKGKQKVGKNIEQTDDEGLKMRYSLWYDDSKNPVGESWFSLHEITLPVDRLMPGVSNPYLSS